MADITIVVPNVSEVLRAQADILTELRAKNKRHEKLIRLVEEKTAIDGWGEFLEVAVEDVLAEYGHELYEMAKTVNKETQDEAERLAGLPYTDEIEYKIEELMEPYGQSLCLAQALALFSVAGTILSYALAHEESI